MNAVLGGLVALAVLAAFPPRPRVPHVVPTASETASDRGLLQRLRVPLAGLCVFGVWVVLGGPTGVGAGLVAAAFAWRVLGTGEGPIAKRRRRELEEGLPFAVHLLGACLRSGAPVTTALDAVAAATGGAVGEEFGAVHARLVLGADPADVWTDLAQAGPLAPLGRALVRAHRSGSEVAVAVDRLSEDLAASSRTDARARARTVEVRAAAPLGLCLLPAFLLLGVVPLVAGMFTSLDLF